VSGWSSSADSLHLAPRRMMFSDLRGWVLGIDDVEFPSPRISTSRWRFRILPYDSSLRLPLRASPARHCFGTRRQGLAQQGRRAVAGTASVLRADTLRKLALSNDTFRARLKRGDHFRIELDDFAGRTPNQPGLAASSSTIWAVT
jgi:hypothetical protein